MASISMDPGKAIEYGNEIIGDASSYKKEVENIYAIVGDLRRTWTGSAAERFTNDIDSYKEDFTKFGELINNFGELLVAIGKDYQDLESNL